MTDLTLDIPEEIWVAVCQAAVDQSLSPSEWVANLMRRELADTDSRSESTHNE